MSNLLKGQICEITILECTIDPCLDESFRGCQGWRHEVQQWPMLHVNTHLLQRNTITIGCYLGGTVAAHRTVFWVCAIFRTKRERAFQELPRKHMTCQCLGLVGLSLLAGCRGVPLCMFPPRRCSNVPFTCTHDRCSLHNSTQLGIALLLGNS